TSIKTSNYTAAANEIVQCNTSGGSFTVSLPPGADVNTTVGVVITTGGNPVYVSAPGLMPAIIRKESQTNPAVLVTEGEYLRLQKVNSVNWLVVSDSRPGFDLTPTAVKTANYTAKPNEHVLADTTTGGFTVTLPDN